ncbi:MAG: CsgG/HfaB family protein [bacterium]
MKKMKNLLVFILLVVLVTPNSSAQRRKKNSKNNIDYDALLTVIENYTPSGNEKTILIFDFKNESFFDSERLGKAISHMFETTISNSQRVKLVDRRMVAPASNSYDTPQLSLADKIQKAKDLEIDYIITGCVTEFGIKKTGTSVSASANVSENNSKIGTGLTLEKGKGTARVAVDIKFIDVETMETVYADNNIGTSFSTNSVIGTELLLSDDYWSEEVGTGLQVGFGVQDFDETLAGKAMRNACIAYIYELIKSDINPFN